MTDEQPVEHEYDYTEDEPRRPIEQFRYGNVKAAVWENVTEQGSLYSVTFSRSYRDEDGWHDTQSFNMSDLLVVGKLANEAHTFINDHRQQVRMEQQQVSSNARQVAAVENGASR